MQFKSKRKSGHFTDEPTDGPEDLRDIAARATLPGTTLGKVLDQASLELFGVPRLTAIETGVCVDCQVYVSPENRDAGWKATGMCKPCRRTRGEA